MKNVFFYSMAVIVTGAACGGSALACTAAPQLTGNSLVGQSAVAGPAPQPVAADPAVNNSIVGLWDVRFYDSTGQVVIDEAYEVFHDDGTEMMTDTSAPATDNVCVGIYQAAGPRTWKLKHVSFNFDLSGNLTGTATFITTVTLEPRGSTFTGNTTITVYDLKGNVVFQATGPVKGTRITVN